ncbi:MAG: DUF4340 domain-containing protein [Oscillospiraceae bacterium]|nr:DUF4340 domain-containing protein [Oscillospiraceae bacterium]
MNKKILGLAGGCVLIAGLSAAVVLVSRQQAAEESSSEAEISAAVTTVDPQDLVLSAQSADNVASIDVENSTGSFVVVRTQKADEATDTSVAFGVKGWEELPTNTALISTLANNMASLTASSVVLEDCSDMDKYGLGSDAAKGTIHFDDGSSFAFRIGSSVSDGENNYFAIEGDDTVYAVKTSLTANYSNSADSFLSLVMLNAPAEEEYPIVNYLTINREDMDYEIKLSYVQDANNENTGGTASNHEMVSPIPAYLSVERSTDVITGMFGASAAKILKTYPEKKDLSEYGLDTPFGTAVMDCDDGNSYTLNIGDKFTETDEDSGTSKSYYPVMLEGVDVIYAMAEDKCVWASVTPTDLASSLVLATYVWDIDKLTLSAEGMEDMEFDITGNDKTDAAVKLNGKSVDTERYRKFYTFLLQTTAEGTAIDEKPVGEPEAVLYFHTKNGKKEQEICFYRQDSYTCLITINGISSFRCRSSFIDTLKENMSIFNTDKDFIMSWS